MKKTPILIGITVVLLGGGILGSLYVMHHKQTEKIARIYQQDNLLYEIDLSTVKKSYTLTIDGENGAENVILVEPNQISMQPAPITYVSSRERSRTAFCPSSVCQTTFVFPLHLTRRGLTMSKSVKHLVMLALFTTMALTIFVVEAQIPVPVPIPGVKLGLANVITLIVLVVYRPRDAFAVLVLRILLGSIFTGTPVSLLYSLTGGILCFLGMALLCKLLQKKHLWFISIVGAVLHNVGQILAAIAAMQSVQVIAYFPFLLVTGCITGFFTGIAADRVIHFLPKSIFPKPAEKPAKNGKHS